MTDKKTEALKLAQEAIDDRASLTRWKKARDAIREALAEQPAQQEPVPVTDNTYNYAKSLAEAIFKQHFASDEHYASGRIVWGVNDTVIGILTQIDNMVADMVRRPAQQQEPVAKPYAYEYGRNNGDGTYSVVIEKGDLVQTAPAVYNYVRPRKAHKDWPIKELFDSPPASKPWVGLTRAERFEIEKAMSKYYDYQHECKTVCLPEFARAIEAKLKEKNHG